MVILYIIKNDYKVFTITIFIVMDSWTKEYGKTTELYARAFSKKFSIPLEDVLFQSWIVLTKELGISPDEAILSFHDVEKMTCAELKQQLKIRGMKSSGSKTELKNRLVEWCSKLKKIIHDEETENGDQVY